MQAQSFPLPSLPCASSFHLCSYSLSKRNSFINFRCRQNDLLSFLHVVVLCCCVTDCLKLSSLKHPFINLQFNRPGYQKVERVGGVTWAEFLSGGFGQ